jgi:hypothetical protein
MTPHPGEHEEAVVSEATHNQHWQNPETGQAECECCCSWALDSERDRKTIAALVEALEWNQRALKAVLESKPFRNVDEAISAAEAALALAKGGKS